MARPGRPKDSPGSNWPEHKQEFKAMKSTYHGKKKKKKKRRSTVTAPKIANKFVR